MSLLASSPQTSPPFSRSRRRARNPIPTSPVPSSAIVTGSGVVVIGPGFPTGDHGNPPGGLGRGVVGMPLTMQLAVWHRGSGRSQPDSSDANCASA